MDQASTLSLHLLAALAAALVAAMLAHRARQSVLTAFLLTGVALGTFAPEPLGSGEVIDQLAQIGIVFLMFVVGVQLSLRDLLRRGPRLLLAAGLQVAVMILAGLGLGLALGWKPLEAFAFGAVLSNSSSTVLARIVGERGETDQEWGRIGLAWSSVQDLSSILLVGALTLLAPGGGDGGAGLALSLGGALVYLVVLVPLALLVAPRLLAMAALTGSSEIFLLCVTVMALAMAWLASWMGISLALGAFIAGIVVSESDLAHRVLTEVLPVRDLFSGLFFVSIGMLLEPAFVMANLPLIIVTAGAIVIGKGLVTLALTRVLTVPRRIGVMVALGLAQSGELSFLLAHVGAELGVLSERAFHVLVAGTILSIVTAPYVVAAGARVLRGTMPDRAPGARLAGRGAAGRVLVCGHGRVGEVVCEALRQRAVPYVVIEDDVRVARALRQRGECVVVGDSGDRTTLERAGIRRASALVVCLSDRMSVRSVVETARRLHPELAIYARTHTAEEQEILEREGATEVVYSEHEIGSALATRALHDLEARTAEAPSHVRDVAPLAPPTSAPT